MKKNHLCDYVEDDGDCIGDGLIVEIVEDEEGMIGQVISRTAALVVSNLFREEEVPQEEESASCWLFSFPWITPRYRQQPKRQKALCRRWQLGRLSPEGPSWLV